MSDYFRYVLLLYSERISVWALIAFTMFPLFFLYFSDRRHPFFKSLQPWKKPIYTIFLIPSFIISRLAILFAWFVVSNVLYKYRFFSPLTAELVLIFADAIYWWVMGKLNLFSQEPLVWRLILFYFTEFMVIIMLVPTFAVLLEYFLSLVFGF